jgi:chlorite dismutase
MEGCNMPTPLLVTFAAGSQGAWRVDRLEAVVGDSLPSTERLDVTEGPNLQTATTVVWVLRGVTSNTRYTNRQEADALEARQQGLARPEATRAALIPIRKTAAWWALAQDERRAIFEERSRHIGLGLEYLPAIARRLHHSRELGEPFDFLTWFEFAPEHSATFEDLVRRLRQTEEWRYVDREVDIRLTRVEPSHDN